MQHTALTQNSGYSLAMPPKEFDTANRTEFQYYSPALNTENYDFRE
jgi:hypothetical protein